MKHGIQVALNGSIDPLLLEAESEYEGLDLGKCMNDLYVDKMVQRGVQQWNNLFSK